MNGIGAPMHEKKDSMHENPNSMHESQTPMHERDLEPTL